ncbi:MAG: hypothetical protein KME18_16780 [Phormidium tanganyikae FI6-MK23]|nr:hypothetical protein [Phormidium tanganyikae FI6-MK23]
MSNSQKSQIDRITSDEELRLFVLTQYFEESLRQFRQTFNLSAISMLASLGIGIFGGGLWLLGRTTEGAVTGATAAVAGGAAVVVTKDLEEKGERIAQEVKLLMQK